MTGRPAAALVVPLIVGVVSLVSTFDPPSIADLGLIDPTPLITASPGIQALLQDAQQQQECVDWFIECVDAGCDLDLLGGCAPALDSDECADVVADGTEFVLSGGTW